MTIRLRGTGRAYTDRVKGLWGETASDVFPKTWMPPLGETSVAAAHAHSETADLPQIRKGDTTGQATRLATWEDEGGATARIK